MDERTRKILEVLEREGKLTSQEVANHVGISKRTLLSHIDKVNNELKEIGISVKRQPRKGIWIEISDPNLFHKYKTDGLDFENLINYTPTQRANFIILTLLISEKPISIDEFQSKIYVAESTLKKDLSIIRQELKQHSLYLDSVRGKGYMITGDEIAYRHYLSEKLKDSDFDVLQSDKRHVLSIIEINELVLNILQDEEFYLSDASYQNLCINIFVLVNRLMSNNYIKQPDESMIVTDRNIKKISMRIIKELENLLEIKFPKNEQTYIEFYLSTKQLTNVEDNFVITNEVNQLINEIFEWMESQVNVHLHDDFELRMNLGTHLVPLIQRTKHGMLIDNPMSEDIKTRFPLAYFIASEAAKIIRKYTSRNLNDGEIAFLALHFNLAIQRNEDLESVVRKKNLLIVCGSGIGTAKTMEYQILHRFEKYIDHIQTTSLIGLKTNSLESFDYILTTIPINIAVNIPILHVSYFLNDQDIQNIKQLIVQENNRKFDVSKIFDEQLFLSNMQVDDKYAAIKMLINQSQEVLELPSNVYESTLEREALFTTETPFEIAIPHTLAPVLEHPIVVTGVLDKPIIWDEEPVKVIFLFLLGEVNDEQMQSFYRIISKYIIKEVYVDELYENPSYQLLKKQLLSIEKNDEFNKGGINDEINLH